MYHIHERIDRLRARLRETVRTEAPGIPVTSLRATVCMPYPVDHHALVYFYGEGVLPYGDFEYATTRLSEVLHEDGLETRFAPATPAAYEEDLHTTKLTDLPERRFVFLARLCGYPEPPDTIVSAPLFAPAVLSFTLPGGAERGVQFLIV